MTIAISAAKEQQDNLALDNFVIKAEREYTGKNYIRAPWEGGRYSLNDLNLACAVSMIRMGLLGMKDGKQYMFRWGAGNPLLKVRGGFFMFCLAMLAVFANGFLLTRGTEFFWFVGFVFNCVVGCYFFVHFNWQWRYYTMFLAVTKPNNTAGFSLMMGAAYFGLIACVCGAIGFYRLVFWDNGFELIGSELPDYMKVYYIIESTTYGALAFGAGFISSMIWLTLIGLNFILFNNKARVLNCIRFYGLEGWVSPKYFQHPNYVIGLIVFVIATVLFFANAFALVGHEYIFEEYAGQFDKWLSGLFQ